jgi:calcium-dependent protein kinase
MIQRQTIGSSYYIAPEVLKASYNEKCDLWSCGVIMYLLLSGRVPFNGKDDEEIFKNVRKGKYDLSEDPFDKISDECRSLLTGLLNMNNSKRLNSYEALNHPFISKYKSKEKFNSINNKREIGKLFDNLKKFKSNSILQDTTLAYLVHNFPQNSDVVNACKLFNLIDKNGDGKISQKELSDYVKENLPEIKENDIKNLFLILDKDNSGFIQYEEFVRGAVTKNKFMEERLLKFAFKFFDKDDSGEITIDEIEELFYKNIKDKKNVKDIFKKIIEEADINKDGKISFREFTKIMKKIIC